MLTEGPTYFIAKAQTDHSYNSSAVWKMRFAAGSKIHGASTPFIFGNRPGANNRTLADIMTWYWISFAVHNDRNVLRHSDASSWPSYIEGGVLD